MSLSDLLLVITMALLGTIGFGWVNVSMEWVYGFAVAFAVVRLLEGLSVISWSVPNFRKREQA